MGVIGGGTDMITGRVVPMEMPKPTQPYAEWLLERIIKYGVDIEITDAEFWSGWASYVTTAIMIDHMVEKDRFAQVATYIILPKAKRYIELMENENE